MSDPFFEHIKRERTNISQRFYGSDTSRFKEYVRMPQIELPEPDRVVDAVSDLLEVRRSTREYSTNPVGLNELATILFWSVGNTEYKTGGDHRPFPSGGRKYPTEAYVIALNIEGIDAGVYHYNARIHVLEQLRTGSYQDEVTTTFGYPFVRNAAAVLCLTFVKSRPIRKYGGLAYKLGLLEAGHVGQNVYLTANALGVGSCSLAGGDQAETYEMLGIDGGNEHLVYGLALGNKKADR